MIRVVTFLWRDPGYRWNGHFVYGPDHVNRLARAVRRNLRMAHEFVCVTDDPAGIDPAVRVVPLWPDLAALGGCWRRLRAFAPDMAGRIGDRFVWLDLDCVVTGQLDPLFDRPDQFAIWRSTHPPTPYCGSLVLMTAGARARVWEEFNPLRSPAACRRYIGTDQAWIGWCLGGGEATWDARDGVHNFRDVNRSGRLPANARLVFFNGPTDPSQPALHRRHPWIEQHWR